MVLAEKNNENARNGRRSRGPSPNGHVQAESTSEDESTGEFLNTFFTFYDNFELNIYRYFITFTFFLLIIINKILFFSTS